MVSASITSIRRPAEVVCPSCGHPGAGVAPMLTAYEAAEVLGFAAGESGTAGAQRVYRLVKSGAIRGLRIGSTLRIPASEIARLVAELPAMSSHDCGVCEGSGWNPNTGKACLECDGSGVVIWPQD